MRLFSKPLLASLLAAGIIGLSVAQSMVDDAIATQAQAPAFEVDPIWPSRCPTTGCSARRSASASIRATTSSSSTAATPRSTRARKLDA